MNPKDIKVGNFYHVLVKVLGINPKNGEFSTETVNEFGTSLNMEPTYFARGEAEAFFPITPENERKNSEPAPKYDPCRLFRKGDRVQVKRRNGRCSGKYGEYLREAYCLVAENEEKNELVRVFHNSSEYRLDPAYLELVTPVEELERYVVEPSDVAYIIVDKKHEIGEQNVVMYMFAFHPNAKAAAEAECARLNAEHRKEQQ